VVVHPAWERVSDLIRENISLRNQPDYDFHGRSLSALCNNARKELFEAAKQWTSAYCDVASVSWKPGDMMFLAGHQPQIFHPGVWFKNFALGRLAERYNSTAVNLIVDSDVISSTSIRVPGGTAERASAAQLPFDRPDPAIPYEERRIEDRELFESFGRRVREQLSQLIKNPLIEKFWPTVVEQSHKCDRLGACIARARHILESQWGLSTLEIHQSRVCELDSFHWFAAHLFARLPKLSSIYNEAVHEYRRLYRIRSASHPVPDLAIDGEWLEAPFWIWTEKNPGRKRLFVKCVGSELHLTDRVEINARLSISDDGGIEKAVEQLIELSRLGIKIRSRALITTLWARLILGDLFIHGIGGGNYDLVTDRIIERFFHRQPPGFMILSATLHLPIDGQEQTTSESSNITAIERQLREMTYHPERFLDDLFHKTRKIPGEVQSLIDTKWKWIERPQTIENARARCQAIRGVNESLQRHIKERHRELLKLHDEAAERFQAEKILTWREYGFCLYPEDTMRTFLAESQGGMVG
jgi:hypothetical protein